MRYRFSCRLVVAGLLLTAALIGAPVDPKGAAAAPVTAEGAAELAGQIARHLSRLARTAGEGLTLQWEGTPTVAAAGAQYDVTLPNLIAIDDDDGSRAMVGAVTFTVTPRDDGEFDVVGKLPGQIPLHSAKGGRVGLITIGGQRLVGLWAPRIESFHKGEGELTGISVISETDKSRISLAKADFRTDLKVGTNGLWSGPTAFSASGLAITSADGALTELGRLVLEGEVAEMDMARAEGDTGKGTQKGASASQLRSRLDALTGLLDGFGGRVRVEGLRTGGVDPLGLGVIELDVGVKDLNHGQAAIHVGYRHDGLTIADVGSEFTPKAARVDMTLDHLPNGRIWETLYSFSSLAPAAQDKAAPLLVQNLVRSLGEASTQLSIKTLELDTPATATAITGGLRFSTLALMGATADIDVQIRGLDAAITALKPAPGAAVDPAGQNSEAMLGLVQAMGQPGKDKAGNDVRTYQIKLDKKGKATLNGADLSALLGGLQQQQSQRQQAPGR